MGNCLRSLRWQVLPAGVEVELLISDFGSAPTWARELEVLARTQGARVVRTPTAETWNRSRALNVGIRAARGAALMCTDADMIFAPDFLASVLAALGGGRGDTGERAPPGSFVVCRCRDLPESLAERAWTRDDFPGLARRAPYRDKLGTGACQAADRAFFEAVRGYDEGFVFWGMEDNDMRYRAGRAGLREVWIHERTAMLHQWHPSQRGRRPLRKLLNDLRFHTTKRRVVKNPRTWGGRP